MKFLNDLRNKRDLYAVYDSADTLENAMELVRDGLLFQIYCIPYSFGGQRVESNMLYVPDAAAERKRKIDSMMDELAAQGVISVYDCVPQYNGKSLVPVKLVISGYLGERLVCQETITIRQ